MGILAQLEKYGFNLEYCRKCLEAKKHNNATTAYYLILKKFIQLRGSSVADFAFRNDDGLDKGLKSCEDVNELLLQTRTRAVKAGHRTGSMIESKKDLEINLNQDMKRFRNISNRTQHKAKGEISFGLRLFFIKASTPRP